MKNKRIFKTLSALCAALVLMGSFSVTAFAQGTEQPPAEDATNDENVVVEETENSPALTPEGNAALVDDFGGNKQLITVTTKAGNYFYILIDRANEDKETAVHFLNQVDEADLMALMEDGQSAEKPPAVCNCTEKCEAGAVNTKCEVCSTDMTGCTGKEPEPETPAEPAEPEMEKRHLVVEFQRKGYTRLSYRLGRFSIFKLKDTAVFIFHNIFYTVFYFYAGALFTAVP